MAKLFFECFQIYLKPIRVWMKEGDIRGHDSTFFIAVVEKVGDVDLGSIWHDQYILRQDDHGKIQAPRFLHAAVDKIFTTGKSVVFLKQLGGYDGPSIPEDEPKLDFHTVCQSDGLGSLAPFSELFDTAFDNWIKSKYQKSSQLLRERLFSDCGLWRSLDALEYIYFLRDGALFSTISATVFEKIDRGKEAWNDQFLLTEMVQSVFGSLKCVDQKKLAARSQPGKYRDVHNRRRSVKILDSISVSYSVSVPYLFGNIFATNQSSFPGQSRTSSRGTPSLYTSVYLRFSFRSDEQHRWLNVFGFSRTGCGLRFLTTTMAVSPSYTMLSVTGFYGFQIPSILT
jgi:gamma-tubulin complex component 5